MKNFTREEIRNMLEGRMPIPFTVSPDGKYAILEIDIPAELIKQEIKNRAKNFIREVVKNSFRPIGANYFIYPPVMAEPERVVRNRASSS